MVVLGHELVGRTILIEDKSKRGVNNRKVKVMGYRAGQHLLYDMAEHSREVINLMDVKWSFIAERYDLMVGRRIALDWDDGCAPCEAFIVARGHNNEYRVVYTRSEHTENIDLLACFGQWSLLTKGIYEVDGKVVTTWSELPPWYRKRI